MSIYPVFVLRQNLGEIETIAFKETEPKLVSGDSQGWLTIWNLDRRRPDSSLQPTNASGAILKVDWIGENHDEIFVQSKGGMIHVWKTEHKNALPLITLSIDYEGFCKAEVIDESLIALPSSSESDVEIWSVKNPQSKTHSLSPEDSSKYGSCTAIAKCGNGKTNVLIGYESGLVSQWDLRRTSHPLQEHICASSPVTCISVDNGAKCAVIGSCDKYFTGIKLQSTWNPRNVELPEEGISASDIRADCLLFGTGGWDSKVRLWNYRTLKPLAVLKYHSKEITSLLLSKSEKQELVTGSRDGTIAVWDVYSKKLP